MVNNYVAHPLPSAAELRELIALKQELNRMYRETGTAGSNE